MTARPRLAKHRVEEAGIRWPQDFVSPHRVHRGCAQPNQEIPCTNQRKRLLLLDSSVRDRTQYLRIEPGITGQFLSIDMVALPITVRDRPQLTNVGHNHFMAKLLQLLADPDRVGSSFHRHACVRNICKPLINRLRCGSETASINDLTVFVEGAVMAPDIPKINADRQLDPGLPAWNFRDEVMRRLLHGK